MKKSILPILSIFIIIQFFRIDQTNPPINEGMDFLTIKNTPPEIAATIKASCYDCHSNETKYPWYANVQPIGWFLQHHINDGRKHLNFSTYATYDKKRQAHKMEECREMIEQSEMPLDSYVMIHTDAKLTTEKKQMLVNYFRKIENETMIKSPVSQASTIHETKVEKAEDH